MARATDVGLTPLMKAQSLRLIDAWPCPVRIARDLTCPDCGFPELGQTFQSELPPLIYCRQCGWAIVPKAPKGGVGLELRERFGKYLLSVNRLPLVVLAAVAIRSWNPDLSVLERHRAEPLAQLVAQTVITAKLNARFVEACANEGPIGSKRRATDLLKSIAKTTQEN